MTQPGEYTSVWERVGELTDGELKALVDSAVAVLNRSAEPDEMITADMSASQVQSQMASALSEAGLPANQQDASAAVSSASDKAAVLAMLSAVAQVPGLRVAKAIIPIGMARWRTCATTSAKRSSVIIRT